MCAPDGGNVCGRTGLCAAGRSCAVADSGTPCPPDTCSGSGDQRIQRQCNGAGMCADGPATTCPGSIKCKSGACPSSCSVDDDCTGGKHCNMAGACVDCLDASHCMPMQTCMDGSCVGP
jgi:hypothetical protein